eukprot:GHVU01129907.1.p1 GENE.GHVU01129907.1~~GHVU01129907.1.p1  ORF type:complete len:154 (-),score=13.67 GHVU01129907.1:388-849(-)
MRFCVCPSLSTSYYTSHRRFGFESLVFVKRAALAATSSFSFEAFKAQSFSGYASSRMNKGEVVVPPAAHPPLDVQAPPTVEAPAASRGPPSEASAPSLDRSVTDTPSCEGGGGGDCWDSDGCKAGGGGRGRGRGRGPAFATGSNRGRGGGDGH